MKLLSTADVITIHDECFLITAIKPSRRNGTCLMEHLRCVVERITYQNAQNGCRRHCPGDEPTDKMNYRVVLKTQDADMLERGLV
jgi:hypothetical protein